MNAYVDIGGTEVLTLKGALLMYRGKSRGFVTWHEVRRDATGGAPFLGEAQELTTDFVHHLAQGLGTAIPNEILSENILVRTAETITGWTCQGSMRSPDDIGVNTISLWEQAFYQSEFTHHTGTRRLTSHPHGFFGLWNSLVGGRRTFPVKYLAPAKETLQEFVTRR